MNEYAEKRLESEKGILENAYTKIPECKKRKIWLKSVKVSYKDSFGYKIEKKGSGYVRKIYSCTGLTDQTLGLQNLMKPSKT